MNNYTGLSSKDLVALAGKIKKLSNSLDEMVSSKSGYFHTKFEDTICGNVDEVQSVITKSIDRTRELVNMKDTLSGIIDDILTAMQPDGSVGAAVYALGTVSDTLNLELNAMYAKTDPIGEDALTLIIEQVFTDEPLFNNTNTETGIDILKVEVKEEVYARLNTHIFDKTEVMVADLENTVPNLSASDMRKLVVTNLFATEAVQNVNEEFQKMLTPIADEINKIAMSLLGGLDRSLNTLLANVSDKVNQALAEATSAMTNAIPVKAAKMDGYAIVRGNRLSQAHIGSEFEVKGSSEKTSFTLNAALDIWNNESNDTAGCAGADEAGNLNVQISTRDITMPLGYQNLHVDMVLLGITVDGEGSPQGIFGAITSKSGLDFEALRLYNLGLATGIGSSETYLGAMAAAKMDDVMFGASFLIGKVCNKEVQDAFIPTSIKNFITIPAIGFNGALVYGEAQIPVWKNGCMLTVNARAKIGTWYLIGDGSSDVYGGIVGGGIFGKGLCIATLGGEMEAKAEKYGDIIRFQGSGWGAAGIGSCDNSWSSIKDSRKDSWCGTGDAQFGAEYNNGWELLNIGYSAVH